MHRYFLQAQWSLYVPQSGHHMYRTVVTTLPHSGHYMYGTVVTICTAKWSLYVPHSGHYIYRPLVTIYTANLTFNNSTFWPHIVFMLFVWISEQTAIISLYSIKWLIFVTATESVYCEVRTEPPYTIPRSAHTLYLCVLCGSQNKQRLFPYTTLTDWFV